jgi:hypothetical protein
MPTEEKTLRSFPPLFGLVLRASSENDCTASKRWSHAVHAYW